MGKIWMPGGGGGADLDVITVTDSSDVLAGKVIVDRDGNPLTGTLELTGDASDSQVLAGKTYYNTNAKSKRTGSMINQGAVNQSLNAGNSYTIPAGYHNGGGKIEANSLAGQTSGTATAAQILSGQTAWVNGSKQTGAMPSYGGTYWNNSLDMGLEADNLYSFFPVGYYAQYDSRGSLHRIPIARLRSALGLTAPRIKKGENIAGVIGTFEGYVPTATDLYLRGNNVKNFVTSNSAYVSFEAGQISLLNKDMNTNYIQSGISVSLVGFSYVNIQYVCTAKASSYTAWIRVGMGEDTTLDTAYVSAGDDTTKSFNVTGYQTSGNLRISLNKWAGYIYRIWLS